MRLVEGWKNCWRWFSVQAFAIQGAAATAWLAVPAEMRNAVPKDWLAYAAVALTILGILGRVVDQGGDG